MKLRNQILAAALLVVASATAKADIPYSGTLQTGANYGGLLGIPDPVTGFDIFSNGATAFFCASATGCGGTLLSPFYTNGQQIDPLDTTKPLNLGDTVHTLFQGVANVVNTGVSAPTLIYPGSTCQLPSACFQITVAAAFDETVVQTGPFVGAFLPSDGGRVSLFYDNSNTASQIGNPGFTPGVLINNNAAVTTGVGYTDGLLLADGSLFGSLPTTISITGGALSGSADARGPLTFAVPTTGSNIVGFQPLPADYQAHVVLAAGGISGFQTANFFDNANGWTSVAVNPAFLVRADANVDLSQVPEPTSIALLGIALVGLAASRRRGRAA